MPENSAYRNNIRVSSYRPKPYSGYSQYNQQLPKYNVQQHLRYRAVDPYHNSYQTQSPYPQYYQQPQQPSVAQAQAKSSVNEYSVQQQVQQPQQLAVQPQQQLEMQLPQNTQAIQKFNIDSVDMTTNQPAEQPAYNNVDYDELAQSYFPHQEQGQISIAQQKMQEFEDKSQNEASRSEKITIVQAQSVPTNHRTDGSEKSSDLPTPAALTYTNSDEEYQNSIANAIMNQKKQFVVGSVVADNFEENPQSAVPEHGPRRRRREAVKKTAKSLDNNEIDEDDEAKREVETTAKVEETTAKKEETSSKKEEPETSSTPVSVSTVEQTTEHQLETTTQYPNYTYNIESTQNNIFDLFRRIIDLKVRLGLNFLQNATVAFQQYLQGVEQRVRASPLFNPYFKNETVLNDTTSAGRRHSNRFHSKPVEAL